MTKLERIGVVATGPLQLLLTAASMVGCINAIVGGVTAALALRSLLEAPVPVAAATGALVALALAALCFGYQVRALPAGRRRRPGAVRGREPDHAGMDQPRPTLTSARWAHTVMTILPRVSPASSARMASGASLSG